nr:MAG TPA: hypothetical protein [Caudoviricetes sp.]
MSAICSVIDFTNMFFVLALMNVRSYSVPVISICQGV